MIPPPIFSLSPGYHPPAKWHPSNTSALRLDEGGGGLMPGGCSLPCRVHSMKDSLRERGGAVCMCVCVCVPGIGSMPYSLILLDAFHWPSSPLTPHSSPLFLPLSSSFLVKSEHSVILNSACNMMKTRRSCTVKTLFISQNDYKTQVCIFPSLPAAVHRNKQGSVGVTTTSRLMMTKCGISPPVLCLIIIMLKKYSTAQAVFGHQLGNYSL